MLFHTSLFGFLITSLWVCQALRGNRTHLSHLLISTWTTTLKHYIFTFSEENRMLGRCCAVARWLLHGMSKELTSKLIQWDLEYKIILYTYYTHTYNICILFCVKYQTIPKQDDLKQNCMKRNKIMFSKNQSVNCMIILQAQKKK